MSETRHTPGPWVLADWNSDDREALIKMCCTAPDEWRWAGWVRTRTIENARLICAAPLLLEACKADAFAEQYWEEHVNSTNGGNVCDTYKGLVDKARQLRCAAISAAEKGGE